MDTEASNLDLTQRALERTQRQRDALAIVAAEQRQALRGVQLALEAAFCELDSAPDGEGALPGDKVSSALDAARLGLRSTLAHDAYCEVEDRRRQVQVLQSTTEHYRQALAGEAKVSAEIIQGLKQAVNDLHAEVQRLECDLANTRVALDEHKRRAQVAA